MSATQTPHLSLPLIAAAQAQKHVTHNEALAMLDALVQLAVAQAGVNAPPADPAEDLRLLIGTAPTGLFAGKAGQLAVFGGGVWAFRQPRAGWIAYVEEDAAYRYCDGTAWSPLPSGERAARLGIATDPSDTNRLAVAAPASLFTHAGAGHQLKLNKAHAADTASLLVQTAYSGRAEIGTTGDEDLRIKVSADGDTWREALVIEGATGRARFPATPQLTPPGLNLLINGDFAINQRGFSGGALAAGTYGFDRWKAGAGGATLTLSGGIATLSAGSILQVIEPAVFGETSFAGRRLTVSVESLTGGALSVTFGGATATLSAGDGIRSAALTASGTATGNQALTLAITSGTPAFRRVKLELGDTVTPWQARPLAQELALAMRYFESSVPTGQNPATWAPGAGSNSVYANADATNGSVTVTRLLAPKRAVPAITIRDGAGTAGRISVYNGAWRNNFTYTGVLGLSDKGFSLQQNNAGVVNVGFDFTAEAEL